MVYCYSFACDHNSYNWHFRHGFMHACFSQAAPAYNLCFHQRCMCYEGTCLLYTIRMHANVRKFLHSRLKNASKLIRIVHIIDRVLGRASGLLWTYWCCTSVITWVWRRLNHQHHPLCMMHLCFISTFPFLFRPEFLYSDACFETAAGGCCLPAIRIYREPCSCAFHNIRHGDRIPQWRIDGVLQCSKLDTTFLQFMAPSLHHRRRRSSEPQYDIGWRVVSRRQVMRHHSGKMCIIVWL